MAALCLLPLGGCGDAPAQPGAVAQPVPLHGATVTPPEVDRALHEAEERSVGLCMQKRGFSYQPVPARQLPFTENPYGLLSENEASVDAYGITALALTAAPDDPNLEVLARLESAGRAAWQATLTGTAQHRIVLAAPGAATLTISTDGCAFIGRETLYGQGWEQQQLTLDGLSADIVSTVLADAGFRKGEKAWATCMRRLGEVAESLQQARGLIQEAVTRADDRASLRRVGTDELRIARHDAACQHQANLAEVVRSVQDRVQAQLPESSWRVVGSVIDGRQRALRSGR
ncbi:hypothetical protein [Amycolatopsis eburnea]|uniref:Uncharacterized protein n=1 Tax=Amycolatopsis eburnea TaxID=2267691 RepID=A0A3R9E2P8_9PSEU|nr:hypothetical protein [Amycolatopsis eburnea]RSD16369.1 hypothetical protein EIY87_22245 [Amycolatopsis eburnea]